MSTLANPTKVDSKTTTYFVLREGDDAGRRVLGTVLAWEDVLPVPADG